MLTLLRRLGFPDQGGEDNFLSNWRTSSGHHPDRATGKPTACRLNVVGPEGHFYQPVTNLLSSYSLTGEWPKTGKGNREGKAPVRYLGRFFYTNGEVDIPSRRDRCGSKYGRVLNTPGHQTRGRH